MAEAAGDPAQALPIDIAYNKLADWLVDRRKVPQDFRKKLATVHARVSAALSTLPRSLDPGFVNLTSDCTGYLEAKHIRDVLSALPESRNLFGRPSGAAGEWDAIVSAYEKDSIFLGEAAQIMVQNANYEIPYQKKQIAKMQQQLTDLERKQAEMKSNAVQSAVKFQQACRELGVPGVNVRSELLDLSKTLPNIFADVIEGVCGSVIGSALESYQDFISYAHSVQGDESSPVLPTLTELRNHPPDVHVDVKPMTSFLKTQSNCQKEVHTVTQADVNAMEINWDVETVDAETSIPIDIDWDIGTVDDFDVQDTGASAFVEVHSHPNDLKPMPSISGIQLDHQIEVESVSQADVPTTETDWDVGTADVETSMPIEIDWEIGTFENFDVQDISVPNTEEKSMPGMNNHQELPTEIIWDIDVEGDGIVSTIDLLPALDLGSGLEASHLATACQGEVSKINWFGETENRSRLLDDLFELKAFLKQRLQEIEGEDTSSLQNQVQAAALSAVPQYGSDALVAMISSVAQVLNIITNRKTRDLILISTSARFLDRLEVSLTQKKQNELKLQKNIEDLVTKRLDLRSQQAVLWPKQEALVARTRSVKQHVEKTLSVQYSGRKVNIIGEINTLLGYA